MTQPSPADQARARLAAYIGYEPDEHDPKFDALLNDYRAAVLREAADKLAALAENAHMEALSNDDIGHATGLENAANELRRMADGSQP